MIITVNGDRRDIDEGAAIVDLISSLALSPERLAVELNKRIVRRADWSSTRLAEGDTVEIVQFVGGG